MSKNSKTKQLAEDSFTAKCSSPQNIPRKKNKKSNAHTLIQKGQISNIEDFDTYTNSNDHIFYSYGNGNYKGNYFFKNGSIFDKICDDDYEYYFSKHAFVERKTEYYMLIWDIDYKINDVNYLKYKNGLFSCWYCLISNGFYSIWFNFNQNLFKQRY